MKYIIDLPDEVKWIQHIQQTRHGTQNLKAESVYDLTPYTEPDEDERYGVNRYKAIGLAFLKWLGNDVGDKLKSADDVYQFLDKNCYNKDAVEQEVWEFARKMISMSGNEVSEMWGCATNFGEVMYNTTYSEAKAKYEEWQKQKDEIRVGDEIVVCDETAVVLWLNEYGNVGGYVYSDGKAYINGTGITSFTKTGRHFSEVAELLKKMREE